MMIALELHHSSKRFFFINHTNWYVKQSSMHKSLFVEYSLFTQQAETCQNLFKSIEISQDVLKLVRTCPTLSKVVKLVQTCQDLFKLSNLFQFIENIFAFQFPQLFFKKNIL